VQHWLSQYVPLTSLRSLPGGQQLVDRLDQGAFSAALGTVSYQMLYQMVARALYRTHVEGQLKAEIIQVGRPAASVLVVLYLHVLCAHWPEGKHQRQPVQGCVRSWPLLLACMPSCCCCIKAQDMNATLIGSTLIAHCSLQRRCTTQHGTSQHSAAQHSTAQHINQTQWHGGAAAKRAL
jgi:hypothetical protein